MFKKFLFNGCVVGCPSHVYCAGGGAKLVINVPNGTSDETISNMKVCVAGAAPTIYIGRRNDEVFVDVPLDQGSLSPMSVIEQIAFKSSMLNEMLKNGDVESYEIKSLERELEELMTYAMTPGAKMARHAKRE